ncbi:ABC transporter permease [Egibacter rhizosphaerae]|uniref:ABC transporter permease n=1 Tax=Egibacter rhizosphaerae TaxID=1670831 RepID=A0A411YF49_9ACTN|nr:ABC transporter permease [Egibacter rhizosphaerae]QBI19848.1 ABC transporter permease [Egibacter rhizosphaerae]
MAADAYPTAATPRATGRGPVATVLLPTASVAVVLGLWELAPRVGWVSDAVMPPFTRTVGGLVQVLGHPAFAENMAATAGRWALGFGIAIVLGVAVGILMGRSRVLFYLIDPILTLSYPVPRAALILILVLWFGVGLLSMVGIVVLGAIIPIVISAYHGAQNINPHLLWSARALGTSRRATLWRVVLPAALPQVLSGLRIGIAISIFTVLASELLIRQAGIGAFLFTNWDHGQNVVVWATGLVLATVGFLLDFVYVRLVRVAVPWLEGQV